MLQRVKDRSIGSVLLPPLLHQISLPEKRQVQLRQYTTRIVTIIPKQREVAKLGTVELSEKAKRRLEILDWYFLKSASHSANRKPNIKLTCRHFGIYRSQFYRRLNRYDKKRLASLEPSSTAPKNKRRPEYSRELVSEVRKIREENQTYSGKKIRPILLCCGI